MRGSTVAKDETRRWRGWRTSQPEAAPRPKRSKRKKAKLHPWFWIRNKKKGQRCERCQDIVEVGQVIAFSRPNKVRCETCIGKSELKPKTSAPLAAERRAAVIERLKKAASDG